MTTDTMVRRTRSGDAAVAAPSGPRQRAFQWAVLSVTGFIVLAPVLPVVWQSFLDAPLYDDGSFTLDNYAQLAVSGEVRTMLLNTIGFAFMTTALAVVLGLGVGFLVIRTDLPGRRVISAVFSWPLYTSALVLAFGWVIVYGPAGYVTSGIANLFGMRQGPGWLYTLPGMAVVAGIAEAPLVYMFATRSLQSFNPALEEAARTLGASPWRVIGTVALPLMRPAMLYSILLVFIAALESLSIPLILGKPSGIEMFASFLYMEGLVRPNPNYGLLAAASIALIAFAALLIWVQGRILGDKQRFVTVTGKATQPRRLALGALRWPIALSVGGFVLFASFIPIVGIVLRSMTQILSPFVPLGDSLTLGNFEQIFSTPSYMSSIQTSLIVALVGAAIAAALAATIGLVAYRSDFRLRKSLDFLSVTPRALPAIVVSIGVFWAMFMFPFMDPLRGTLWILVFAFIIRFLPLGIGVVVPAFIGVHRDLDNAARMAGASWLRATTAMTLRLSAPAVAGAYIVLFSHFLREYASAVYLISPGVNVIGTSMLQLWDQGIVGAVAAFAMIQIALGTVVVLIGKRLTGVKAHG